MFGKEKAPPQGKKSLWRFWPGSKSARETNESDKESRAFRARLQKRTAACFFLIAALLFVSSARLLTLGGGDNAAAARAQSSVRVEITRPRGTIFDANLTPLTNRTTRYMAAAAPVPEAVVALRQALPADRLEAALDRLEQKRPTVVELDQPVYAQGITMFSVFNRYDEETQAVHLLGYLDNDGHGASGVEKAYDELFYSETPLSAVYTIDAAGRVLPGVEPEIEGSAGSLTDGLALTIDSRIQAVVEKSIAQLDAGAAVVLEVGTGKIRAMSSRPAFSPLRLADSLAAEGAPFINRALTAYNVGSIFKPCVAAAALEKGISKDLGYTCTGSMVVGGRTFHCNHQEGHGPMNLLTGLEKSCNPYFYNLAAQTGAGRIMNMAKSLGFGQSRYLAEGMVSDAGTLPNLDILERQPAALANLSIGQGDLLLSPLAICSLYEAVAGDGSYHAPSLVEGKVTGGVLERGEEAVPTKVMSRETAAILREGLARVVQSGTGTSGAPETGGAGGKTATAETGWIKDGRKVNQAWFAGFYPAEQPQYVIVVLAEDGAAGGSTCGPVFKAVCDGIAALSAG
ncbi:MAG: penicillin-binding protein 2 [Clostridiales bacterium]|nr:penicillin-binding protein 2 [Clostridiales bacterium]